VQALSLHFCCRTLRTFTANAAGKLASIVRVNVRVVLSRETATYAKRLFTNSSLLNVAVYGTRLPTRSATWLLELWASA
jgi:hypothetical protein